MKENSPANSSLRLTSSAMKEDAPCLQTLILNIATLSVSMPQSS